MNFGDLHENLRREILRRIDRGVLSGAALSRATGFEPGHISHFLKRKRILSLDGLDRVLTAQKLSILDLIPADTFSAAAIKQKSSLTRSVPLVSQTAVATVARIRPADVLETVEIPDTVLHHARERAASGKDLWHRWASVRVDAAQSAEMSPLLNENDVAVIDRHYNSLAVYRPHQRTVYAVYAAGRLHLCFAELETNRLVLRPHSFQMPVRLVDISEKNPLADAIVGRIVYVLSER